MNDAEVGCGGGDAVRTGRANSDRKFKANGSDFKQTDRI
jgi:hypothetical protein